jgi:seryl-tRNA synthetase
MQKLEEMEKRLRESEEKGSTLQRYSDNLQKNFNRQISNDKSKHQETTKALTQLKRAHEELKLQCKEQEKILDITNIYRLVVKIIHQSPLLLFYCEK